MTRSVLRFGIVGSGYMAKTHSLALRNIDSLLWPEMPKIDMVRMIDINPEAAEKAPRAGVGATTAASGRR